MDWSLLGSSVHGILQARILKWGCHSLLRGIFPTEGSNLRLLHSKWNLYRWATREALNLNFLIPERWCLLQRFAIRTEFDHIREVLRSWRMTCFLSALLPLLYTREVSKQTGSIQNFLNYKLLPSPESCVQTIFLEIFSRVINSVAQSCPALCDPMDFSTPGLPVCPSPTPRVYPNSCPLSQWCHSAISSSVIPFSSHLQSFPASGSVAKVLEFQLQHQSFQWMFRTDFLQDGLVGSPCSPRDSQESSPTPQFKSINSSALSFLYSPTLTSIHDHGTNHSLD